MFRRLTKRIVTTSEEIENIVTFDSVTSMGQVDSISIGMTEKNLTPSKTRNTGRGTALSDEITKSGKGPSF